MLSLENLLFPFLLKLNKLPSEILYFLLQFVVIGLKFEYLVRCTLYHVLFHVFIWT